MALPLSAAGPATADSCTPELKVLESTGHADSTAQTAVHDLGPNGLAVGQSGDVPVYWTGTTVHRVPLPKGFTRGTVRAVNSSGLMVGVVTDSAFSTSRAFSYRLGSPRTVLLHTTGRNSSAADVNDAGVIVGTQSPGAGVVWQHTRIVRELPEPLRSVNEAGTTIGSAFNPDGSEQYHLVVRPQGTTGGPATLLQPGVYPIGDEELTGGQVDNHGRIVGGRTLPYPWAQQNAYYWDSPYDAAAGEVPALAGASLGIHFNATSPNSGLTAGKSQGYYRDEVGWAVEQRAIVWPGSGPALALPRLSDTEPTEGAEALAASDTGDVAGWSEDADGIRQAVVWTCAMQQTL
ncbi:hypothetical protein ACFQLX_24495 [Streptomyces polyrhachis]|uniref:Uncharacterized protein n=1 Tax=Streptomyces polyrhachis TaxID=1282885 RepID=A0ABW2GP34_9ACTN